MRIDGKVYRHISITYFLLHCLHLVLMIIGSLLPYIDSKNAYQFFGNRWPFLCVGFALLAIGCFFAWCTIKCRPYYCIASFGMTLAWNIGIFFSMGIIGLGLAFGAKGTIGIGVHIISYGLLMICFDIAYLLYMLVLLFVTPREKLKK